MQHSHTFVLFFCLLLICNGCKNQGDKTLVSIDSTSEIEQDTLESIYDEDPMFNSRAIWQKPELVIRKLGDLDGKVIADIGAGFGYFSFRFIKSGASVIAIEIEPSLVKYIDSVGTLLPAEEQKRLQTRLAESDNPGLQQNEVDIVVIINTIAYLPDTKAYIHKIKSGLRNGGTIMIVDYKMKRLPIQAPPKSERIYLDKLEDILNDEGFSQIVSDDVSLDYQYILTAKNNK
ncbi:MAG: class I SAM-dependent methyltransferase [Saprospiraceae bacterium]|nr:MAG: type 12 methyltransferase [Bacteroidetes bacterium OLB9]MCO6462579.1 class I SAM-dependent methyltransferase [Saprospiraceae bacterium]MCZ2337387.1 class I SAM-dependent methyltransferase [Chitinophagales bacterium]